MRAGMTGVAERRGRGGRRRGGKRLAWPRPRTQSRRRPRSAQPATRRAEEHDRTRRARALLRAGPTSSDSSGSKSYSTCHCSQRSWCTDTRDETSSARRCACSCPFCAFPFCAGAAPAGADSCGSARSCAQRPRELAPSAELCCWVSVRARLPRSPPVALLVRRRWRGPGRAIAVPVQGWAAAAAKVRQRRPRARPGATLLARQATAADHWLQLPGPRWPRDHRTRGPMTSREAASAIDACACAARQGGGRRLRVRRSSGEVVVMRPWPGPRPGARRRRRQRRHRRWRASAAVPYPGPDLVGADVAGSARCPSSRAHGPGRRRRGGSPPVRDGRARADARAPARGDARCDDGRAAALDAPGRGVAGRRASGCRYEHGTGRGARAAHLFTSQAREHVSTPRQLAWRERGSASDSARAVQRTRSNPAPARGGRPRARPRAAGAQPQDLGALTSYDRGASVAKSSRRKSAETSQHGAVPAVKHRSEKSAGGALEPWGSRRVESRCGGRPADRVESHEPAPPVVMVREPRLRRRGPRAGPLPPEPLERSSVCVRVQVGRLAAAARQRAAPARGAAPKPNERSKRPRSCLRRPEGAPRWWRRTSSLEGNHMAVGMVK